MLTHSNDPLFNVIERLPIRQIKCDNDSIRRLIEGLNEASIPLLPSCVPDFYAALVARLARVWHGNKFYSHCLYLLRIKLHLKVLFEDRRLSNTRIADKNQIQLQSIITSTATDRGNLRLGRLI